MYRALVFALLLAAAPAVAQEGGVPLYSSEEALRLSYKPVAYMLDETTCQRVEGHRLADGTLAGAGERSALYRLDETDRAFMRVRTRADGVYVARFPAHAGEVTLSRAYIVDPRTKRFIYGEPTAAVCKPGRVEVGDLVPARDEKPVESRQAPFK